MTGDDDPWHNGDDELVPIQTLTPMKRFSVKASVDKRYEYVVLGKVSRSCDFKGDALVPRRGNANLLCHLLGMQ
ncbi:hypothetical protein NDU88_005031 [Pleurodeles waltl]|uniref:Uncharacterized protein n=1 Tax=Pleurodeles waltl TaxID=8319 RepID=A0AAV7WWS1_PLEWA|nr:hypothetical protein NDU88_005031 [Pleurodeles waltl]